MGLFIWLACETGSAHFGPDLKNSVLTETNGMTLCRGSKRKGKMIMKKMMNTKTEGNTFTKKIGQTVYVVRYHFNEDAKETMQEKINRMLVTEASRMAVY